MKPQNLFTVAYFLWQAHPSRPPQTAPATGDKGSNVLWRTFSFILLQSSGASCGGGGFRMAWRYRAVCSTAMQAPPCVFLQKMSWSRGLGSSTLPISAYLICNLHPNPREIFLKGKWIPVLKLPGNSHLQPAHHPGLLYAFSLPVYKTYSILYFLRQGVA